MELEFSNSTAPGLRLVREVPAASRASGHDRVERENRAAAGLAAADARALLGEATAAALDGGRAAILSPERRRRLIEIGERLGVRAFDANLVIAVVQDRVRRGENWRDWMGGGRVVGACELPPRSRRVDVWGRALVIAVLATTLSWALIAWTLGLLGG